MDNLKKLQDLTSHQCLVIKERDHPFGVWQLSNKKGTSYVKVSGNLAANDGSIVRFWALDGHGIMLRSIWDVSDELLSGKLVHILPDYWQEADIWAVYPSRLSSSAKLRVCVEYFEEELPKRLAYIKDVI